MKKLTTQDTLIRSAFLALLAISLWFFPAPQGLELAAWHLFSIFFVVILGLLMRPFPMGPTVLIGLIFLVISKTMTLKEALSGFGDSTVWLVVAAFLIAGGVINTGFGKRLALLLITSLGKSTLGLGYALCGSELLLGPFVPSNTARGGGILAPIARSLMEALDSYPHQNPQKIGRYLSLLGSHANLITASMFVTGMAANPLVVKAASDIFGLDFGWQTWALGALIPGLTSLGILPLFLFYLTRPTLKDTRPALKRAKEELKKMGPWKREEKIMGSVFILLILLWVSKSFHHIGTTTTAWIGVLLLVITNTESWKNMTHNDKAWDTLIWLGGLLTLANSLKSVGFVAWFADNMQTWLSQTSSHASGIVIVVLMAIIYFYSMYCFSMLTAHISAFVAAFFLVSQGIGAPSMLTVALLAYFSNLCGCLTHYSSGPVIIYFGQGYVPTHKWFSVGFIMSLFHLGIWLSVGLLWWKILGWY